MEEGKKLTKGQKKALKEKAKREAAAKAEAEAKGKEEAKGPPPAEPAPAKGPGGKKGKGKKKGGAAANLIKKKLQEKKEEQEAIEAEERRLREEALAIQKAKEEEERKIKEEAEKKEKERIEEIRKLKKAGLWMSEKEKQKKEEMEAARRQLIEQGLVDEDAFAKAGEEGNKPKIVYASKKRRKNKNKGKNNNEEKKTEQEDSTPKTTNEAEKTIEKAEEPKETPNVQPGQEEKVEEVQKQSEEPKNQIDDDQKADDWEDFLDDDVVSQQVQIQEDVAPSTKINNIEEETTEVASTAAGTEAPKPAKQAPVEEAKVPKQSKPSKSSKKEDTGAVGGGSIFERNHVSKKNKRGKGKKKHQEVEEEVDDGEKLRCPIICVLGHVDTGKTLLLDKIRKTNVQRGEAGGITQQIGATYFPGEALQKNVDKLDDSFDVKEVEIPGLLVIDTPGHESFTNLRSRGSNLCDLAVLVVDVMHGLEQQTLESIDLLKKRKTPFIVALNKIDMNHGWKKVEYRSSKEALDAQAPDVISEFEDRRDKAFLQFNERGMNIVEYWKNDDPRSFISAVPTSAMTGEGIPDILGMIVKCCQKMLRKKIIQRNTEFQCTVLEVKKISGVGTTVDVVLVNGKLSVGDTIVLAGFNGPIVTKIRALLTPHPMKEIRVKGDYIHHDTLYGSMGIKISAPDLDHALAGGELYRADNDEQIDELCDEISENMFNFAEKYVNPSEQGVCVQASTLGSLEALLEFLKQMKVPVCSVNIGAVYKKDVMKALKAISGDKRKKEYATILAFDVKIDDEARDFAEENEIVIFEADIIYNLFDMFTEHVEKCEAERKQADSTKAIFPCVFEIINKDHIFRTSSPIVLGVEVKAGILKVGTPVCVPDCNMLKIGTVTSIQKSQKDVKSVRSQDGGVSIKIENNSKIIHAGKSFTHENQIVSAITRDSIDVLKAHYKDELEKDDWRLVVKLKKVFNIV